MAEFKIEVPEPVDYTEKWANKVPENERIEIPAKDGGRTDRDGEGR